MRQQPKSPDSCEGYPRPLLRRREWFSLDGQWEFALDPGAVWHVPQEVEFSDSIRVPFAPETAMSGVNASGFFSACWYRRQFRAPPIPEGHRLMLHFGAVDTNARVWLNDRLVVEHSGGYTPFRADVAEYLLADGMQTIVVRAEDDPHDLTKPRGKQDWQLKPHSIWYPRTSGIWQTVWAELLPSSWIDQLRWTPRLDQWELSLEVRLAGRRRDDLRLAVRLTQGQTLLADDTYTVIANEVHRRIALSDPGVDDFRNELLWSPAHPTLIDARLRLEDDSGNVLDEVLSYSALRSIGIQGNRFVLNSRPFALRMVLDQGYWPESGMSAPDDGALRRDVELAKQMGFNGVRYHQRTADPRYLYWADRLGLLVWGEMPSAYRFTKQSINRVVREWTEVVERDASHPCIVAWVPLNESWGVPDLPDSPAQRHYVQALYHLTRTLDPTRPVIGNDGWESVATDIIGIHDYDDQPRRLLQRYGGVDLSIARLNERERPGGRLLVVEGDTSGSRPIMITEFGGISLSRDGEAGAWGYSRARDRDDLADRYAQLLTVIRSLPFIAGFCYTQFADTYQETNGLLYADRSPKIPLEEIALFTAGEALAREGEIEPKWRERLMRAQMHQLILAPEEHHGA